MGRGGISWVNVGVNRFFNKKCCPVCSILVECRYGMSSAAEVFGAVNEAQVLIMFWYSIAMAQTAPTGDASRICESETEPFRY